MSDKKTAHTEAELIKLFKQDGIAEQYFSKFLAYYKICFDDAYEDYKDWEDNDWDEGDSVQASALWCTNRFIKPYLELTAKGHGEEWAHEIAHSAEEGEKAIFFTHADLHAINPELARKELLIHAKSLGGDVFFEKHYIFLFEVVAEPEGRIETAQQYSKIYKEEIAKGKSAVYAHQYADLISEGEFHETYCKEYAFAFDKAIGKNKSNEYAKVFADKYANSLVDIKMRYGISEDQEMIDFAIEKVNAFMKAWEYAKEHRLNDFNRFAEIYENEHFNVYFPNEIAPDWSIEELDKLVLEKTLARFNK